MYHRPYVNCVTKSKEMIYWKIRISNLCSVVQWTANLDNKDPTL